MAIKKFKDSEGTFWLARYWCLTSSQAGCLSQVDACSTLFILIKCFCFCCYPWHLFISCYTYLHTYIHTHACMRTHTCTHARMHASEWTEQTPQLVCSLARQRCWEAWEHFKQTDQSITALRALRKGHWKRKVVNNLASKLEMIMIQQDEHCYCLFFLYIPQLIFGVHHFGWDFCVCGHFLIQPLR